MKNTITSCDWCHKDTDKKEYVEGMELCPECAELMADKCHYCGQWAWKSHSIDEEDGPYCYDCAVRMGIITR